MTHSTGSPILQKTVQTEPQPLSTDESELCLPIWRIALRYGVSKSAVRTAVRSGEIPHFRLGELYRIRPSRIPEAVLNRWRFGPKRKYAELPKGAIVYFIGGVPGYVKIGFTIDMKTRLCRLQVGHPEPVKLLAWAEGGRELEQRYHMAFAEHRRESEWFALVPAIQRSID